MNHIDCDSLRTTEGGNPLPLKFTRHQLARQWHVTASTQTHTGGQRGQTPAKQDPTNTHRHIVCSVCMLSFTFCKSTILFNLVLWTITTKNRLNEQKQIIWTCNRSTHIQRRTHFKLSHLDWLDRSNMSCYMLVKLIWSHWSHAIKCWQACWQTCCGAAGHVDTHRDT